MKYNEVTEDFLHRLSERGSWVTAIDKVGQKHGGRLMKYDEHSIELHGVGTTIMELISLRDIVSLSDSGRITNEKDQVEALTKTEVRDLEMVRKSTERFISKA